MTVLMLLAVCGGLFDVSSVAVEQETAVSFFAPLSSEGPAGLFILDGSRLVVHSVALPETRVIPMEHGTSVVDVFDADGDGISEVIAVCGKNILRYKIPEQGPIPPAETLFTAPSLFSGSVLQPRPHVLAVNYASKVLIALPCEEHLELRRLDGTIETQWSVRMAAGQSSPVGPTFSAWTMLAPQIAGRDGLEMRVSRTWEYAVALPDDLRPPERSTPRFRHVPQIQFLELSEVDQDRWPWFPLRVDGNGDARVLYAPAQPGFKDTLVRIRGEQNASLPGGARPMKTSPVRRYPGLPALAEDELPDFDKDGFTDLLLWTSPDPIAGTDALGRILAEGVWPVRVSAHLYRPEKARYDPRPASSISLKLPISWFLIPERGTPLRHRVFRDFNGDGRTDCGWSSRGSRFEAWLFQENGFPKEPSFGLVAPEPIERVEHCADLDQKGRTSVVLRTRRALHVLYASIPEP